MLASYGLYSLYPPPPTPPTLLGKGSFNLLFLSWFPNLSSSNPTILISVEEDTLQTNPVYFHSNPFPLIQILIENSMDVSKKNVQQRFMRMGRKLTLPGVSVVPSVGHMRRPLYGGKTRHSRWLFSTIILVFSGPGFSCMAVYWPAFLASVWYWQPCYQSLVTHQSRHSFS